VVDHRIEQMEWTPSNFSTANNTDIYRLVRPWIWDCMGQQFDSGHMVTQRTSTSHQPERTTSYPEGIPAYSYPTTPSSSMLYRQYFSHCLYKKLRRHQIIDVEPHCFGHLDILLSELHTAINAIRPITVESSRRTVPRTTEANRMVTPSTNLQMARSDMGSPPCRSLRISIQPSTTNLRVMELPPSSDMDQCIQPTMDFTPRSNLLGSPMELITQDSSDPTSSQALSNPNHSKLAHGAVVSASPATSHMSSSHPRHSQRTKKRSRNPPSEEQTMEATSVEPSLKRLRLSDSAISIIEASRSDYKQNQYKQASFVTWCQSRDLDPLTPSVHNLLNFLADNHSLKKWKNSTTLNYAATILQLYSTADRKHIRQSNEYIQFCKGLKASNILPLKSWDYDITPALEHLISLGLNEQLSLEQLTAKTAWLLAMVGFLRPSDIERIDLSQCSVSSDNILKLVVVAPKEKRFGSRITKAITIHPHPNDLLCPVLAYISYLSRIASNNAPTPHPAFAEVAIDALFRNLNNRSIAIGHERISKHIQSIMQFVSRPPGAPIPKARALGSTLAAQSGISVEDIVVQGNWLSREIFEQFYRISVTTANDFVVK
jgi:hypothetical protein